MAAVIVQEERLLMVSKQAAPDVFYLPGGKPDPGEGATETLHRELGEELGVRPVGSRFLADVAAQAVLEGVPMMMTVFEVGISQVPHPAAELADTRWVSSGERDVKLAPAVREHVLPLLRQRGLLAAYDPVRD
ncbi:NUDIX hydrolase [Streptomyces violaceusniger]